MINYLAVEGQPLLTDLTVVGSNDNDLVVITQTGTGNALRVEDADSLDSSAFIIDQTGNVGIGKQPGSKLDVDGTAAFSSTMSIAGNTTIRSASGRDAIVLQPRNGGTSSFSQFVTTATLSANRTLTLPDANGNVITTGNLTSITTVGTVTSGTIDGGSA
jgi:hypothetical protein